MDSASNQNRLERILYINLTIQLLLLQIELYINILLKICSFIPTLETGHVALTYNFDPEGII